MMMRNWFGGFGILTFGQEPDIETPFSISLNE